MDITIYLASIWGPLLVAVGFGFFISSQYYIKIYRDLEKAPLAVLFFGMLAMAAGIAQIQAHNWWSTLPEITISLLGWALLIKGLICTVVPKIADRGGDSVIDAKLIPGIGSVALIIGLYLSWVGYMM